MLVRSKGLTVTAIIFGIIGTFTFSGNPILPFGDSPKQIVWAQATSSQQDIAETTETGKEWVLGTPLGSGKALPSEVIAKAVEAIQAKRAEKGVTLAELSKLTGRSPVYIAAALRGQARLHPEAAQKVAKVLGLDEEMTSVLTACPVRNQFPCTTDPLKYRLLEVIGVYGDAIRDACNELFGDGIMSAITFKLSIDKEVLEGTEYVVITMKGKWLPYKEF